MDTAQAANAPREFAAGGETFLVSALTHGEWGRFQAWLKDYATDPVTEVYREFAKLEREGIPVDPDEKRAALAEARRRMLFWPPAVRSEAWLALINQTPDADEKFVHLVLSKHRPSLTFDEAVAISRGMDQEAYTRLSCLAIGIDLPPKPAAPPTRPARPRATAKKTRRRG